MARITFERVDFQERAANEYYPVESPDGKIRCSCGRELIRIDEDTFQCPGGYPTYRLSGEDIIKDKFGGLSMRSKPHTPN